MRVQTRVATGPGRNPGPLTSLVYADDPGGGAHGSVDAGWWKGWPSAGVTLELSLWGGGSLQIKDEEEETVFREVVSFSPDPLPDIMTRTPPNLSAFTCLRWRNSWRGRPAWRMALTWPWSPWRVASPL
ncbi:PREDICTED: uncharacterized protein LOC108522612 isoform X2 [Rhinopithecus bieti]|uniref:uncharacterized protein LOC108522612 isoform X2 n=1 Tax=Rhinopithecus bieti TaxID=61621 RepID=UPI00083BC09D|nr:PREDICTED: uncharacterized protein LOC108522612 isoform X2 [Rhinopithecus bieti]